MNSAIFESNDHDGVEARGRVLDILAATNTVCQPFEDFTVERTYEDRNGYRCATSFINPKAASYGNMKTRITITMEIDENENPELQTLVTELTEAELAEARSKAMQERESAQAAAAAAQARLDALDAVQAK